jgi:hypothetical protein
MNDANEYLRLTQLYKQFGDAELLELQSQVDQLTDIAQDVLRAEVSSRGLIIPVQKLDTDETADADTYDQPPGFGRLSSPDCIWEFAEQVDAKAAAAMLSEAGIVYDIILPSRETLDMSAPRIAVLPRDKDRVRQLLSHPIPEEYKNLASTEDLFVPPSCPRCNSEDPLLESIDPTNKWLCEVCGHTWQDQISR